MVCKWKREKKWERSWKGKQREERLPVRGCGGGRKSANGLDKLRKEEEAQTCSEMESLGLGAGNTRWMRAHTRL